MTFNYPSPNKSARPHSSVNMTDLHIYVVPLDLWDEQQNLALNEIINETVSAGFIRVEPEIPLSDLRIEIDQQLGYEFIPKDYVFCKSVGRCLAQVREKQENLLKAKHFLPPNSYNSELFVVDSIVAKRSQMTSDSNKTYNSSLEPELRVDRRSMEENIRRERLDYERAKERQRLENENNARLIQREIDEKEAEEILKRNNSQKMKERENEFNNKKIEIKLSNDPKLEERRNEIEELQKEIMKRYQELETLENTHQKKISEWKLEYERQQQEEEERRRLFEEMEMERKRQEAAIITKQKEDLQKLEEMLKEKKIEISKTENELELERNKREEVRLLKENEMEELKEKLQDDSKPNPDMNNKIQELQKELEEIEKKQKDLEEMARLEREEAEINFQKAQLEFQRLKVNWEEERNIRDKENAERLLEEQRMREIHEQRQREHEERMEKEKRRMIEEREKFDEEQRHWDEERMRYEEEEKNRLEEMEAAIQEAYNNKPIVPKFELTDPNLILEGATENEQKNHLNSILKSLKAERELEEKIRDNALKKIRSIQSKIQSKRNNLRDIWKKKYLEEKKKTPPLEDQLNRYKDELESLHRKLTNSIEIGMRDQRMLPKHPGVLSPSNKANLLMEAFRIQHDIEELQQKIEFNQMRLSAERKLRAQTETELKILKIEAMQKKIRLTRTRSDQLAIIPHTETNDFIYSPHNNALFNGSIFTTDSVNL